MTAKGDAALLRALFEVKVSGSTSILAGATASIPVETIAAGADRHSFYLDSVRVDSNPNYVGHLATDPVTVNLVSNRTVGAPANQQITLNITNNTGGAITAYYKVIKCFVP